MTWFFRLDVIDGPLPLAVWGLTVVGLIVLLIRRPTPAWLWRIVIALGVGVAVGVAAVAWANTTNAFGVTLPPVCRFWIPGGLAATLIGAVSLWERGVWRKVVAGAVVVLSLVSTALGVNAAFGIDRTVGAIFGIPTQEQFDGLPTPAPTETTDGPLYQTWTPPADMKATGETALLSGAQAIPSTGGFAPRNATIYLPPAARTANPPRLPLVVMMMGYPGNPDPSFVASALDRLAAANKGLAPIVIVADQLGNENQDPVCANTKKYGDVPTYVNKDIPDYATARLPVLLDHKYWTIMGYSNGGACAFTWAAQHPDIWGNVIAISPDEYPGVEWADEAVRTLFDGDAAAFDANKPAAGLAANKGRFAGHLAVFTVGQNDPGFRPGAEANAALATAAGFDTTFSVVPGADHLVSALDGGIPLAMELLYRHLGLSAP
ncbi:esterase family protein [Microbacterium sp. SORGH_AS_0888]|uniref:alpha/beta hydrolase n=1 Tax=Microbacterium sp. SORGH_AS_0888 TaxID=3041791 RepID=UPI002780CEF1|nr:alpha/beta hydrolase-fold protein [Microbacterium sp. SORGH_AS_0888]MDQ1129807.1 enterochelin esterase-like enzyme [Microbacterium sp. SORGH_AS_0888]